MCCFSGPVRFVGATKIFARGSDDGRQLLAYAMNVTLDTEVAMVLPLPVPPRPAEDALRFIDLSAYATLFDDLHNAFPAPMAFAAQGLSRGGEAIAKTLVVHDVGSFEASFVPTHADFARLDARFRIPDGVWQRLPTYADWGFAVFRLKPSKTQQKIHPMAFSFPRRDPRAIFFPTVHVHDGAVHDTATFDHTLYCQASGVLDATLGWSRSSAPLGSFVDIARAQDLVDGARGGGMTSIFGKLPNEDIWLHEPVGVALHDLRGRGSSYSYEVKGGAAHLIAPGDPAWQRRKETSQTKLANLCLALRDGLRAIEAQYTHAWHLARLSDDLPPHFMNGDRLFTGATFGPTSGPAMMGGPGRVLFQIWNDRVEPQNVTLGFARLPDADEVLRIRATLVRILDQV
jgi:hypothetical protein